MDTKPDVTTELYQSNVQDEAEKILLNYYWEHGDGYLGREHYTNAINEINVRISETRLHTEHFKNNIYLLDRLIFLNEVKIKLLKM
jgi:hypothetical protein